MHARLRLTQQQQDFLLQAIQVHFPRAYASMVYDNQLPTTGSALTGWLLDPSQRHPPYLAITARGELDLELKVEMDHGFYEARIETKIPQIALQYISPDKIGYLQVQLGDIGHPTSFNSKLKDLLNRLKPRPTE